jgi:hypothetical protein
VWNVDKLAGFNCIAHLSAHIFKEFRDIINHNIIFTFSFERNNDFIRMHIKGPTFFANLVRIWLNCDVVPKHQDYSEIYVSCRYDVN